MATTLKYMTQVKAIVPTGESPVWPDFAVPMTDGPIVINPAGFPGYDFYYKNWRDEISLSALTVEPAALTPVVSSDPKVLGSWLVRFMASNDQVIFDESSVVASTGLVVENLGAGLFRVAFDSALVAATPSGQTINATFTVRARKKWSPTEYVTFANVQLQSTGTAVVATPAPIVIGQPQPLSFSEGVVTNFNVNIASFFTVNAAALPATYSVTNFDGSPLTNYVLNSLVAGVANISNPTAAGIQSLRFNVTDNLGRSAYVVGNYTVLANPLPIVLSTPPARNVPIGSTGTFALAAATLFTDTEALTYQLRNSDGTAPPGGYSYDGTNLAYPTEGGAVTRNFLIRATESGPLARTVDTLPFVFDRPAAAVTIVTAADVTFPENAATTKRIDVRTILGTDAAEAITLADGSALPGRYVVNALGSGVFDVTGTFSNNQILTDAVKYAGTNAGSPVQALPNFKSYHNPPVDGVPATIVANADQPITINVVALSDDPTNNLIVAGSAFSVQGEILISADFKSLVITPPNSQSNQITYSYTLEATSGGPQTAVTGRVIDFRAIVGPLGAGAPTISTQSTDGTSFPSFNLSPYWTAGSYPIDVASYQFYDSNDVALGKTQVVAGAGTFSINASGVASFTAAAAGYVGVQNLRVAPSDINGNLAETIKPWVHTQVAKPSDPPPPDPNSVFPNTLDGKPIIQLGVENPHFWSGSAAYLKNQRQIVPLTAGGIGSKKPWSTNLKTAFEKIRDGEHDTTTGWFKLAPTEDTYIYQPRWYQSSDPTLNQGDWEIDIDVMTGGTATFTITGWAETGSTAGNSGGQSALVNGGSPFTFDRKRFVRNLTNADTFQGQYRIQNNTGSDIWIRYWYGGLVSDFATWTTQPFRDAALSDFYEQKILRIMDACFPALARAAYADDMVRKGDYITFGDGGSWVSRLTANNFYRRTGTDIHMWAKACVDSSTALWFNVPMTFGMGITDGLPDGFYTSSAIANSGSGTATNAAFLRYRDTISANFDAIIAGAKIEYRKYAQRFVQDLIDANYPDNYIVYIECANEMWNTQTEVDHRYAFCIEYHIKNRTDGKPQLPATSNGAGGAGYIANLMFTEFAKVISEMKPNQQHEFVVGAQTPSANWGDRCCLGWNTFIQEFPTNSLPIARLGLTTTNYWSGAFKWHNQRSPGRGNPWGVATSAEFVAAWQASYAVSLQNLENDIVAWYLNPTSTNSSIAGQMAFIDQNIATCNKFGCKYLGSYEGSFHDDLITPNVLITALGTSTVTNARNAIFLGAGGEIITRAAIQAFIARYPGKIISNYYKYTTADGFGPGGQWFEKSLSEFGTVPTTGAAKAWYDYGRQGAVAPPPPPTGGVFKETFEINNTPALLTNQGWTLGTGYSVVSDASQSSLYNPSEFNDASKVFRTSAQANGNIALRMKFKPAGNTAAYAILEQVATGDKIVIAPASGGHISVSYLGNNAPIAVTTSGVNYLDGNYHDITITYYAAVSGGLIEVKDTVGGTVRATLSGNTALHYSQVGSAANVDKLTLRGLVYYAELEDVTSAPPTSPMWYTPFRLDYAAGTEAGFVQRIDTSHFSTGAAHEFFLRAQADGGDIRVYTDNGLGTRLPLHIVSFNKAAGTILAYTRVTGSRVQNDTIILEVGGDGTKSQPAANAAFGSQAVYADFDFVSHDLTKNEKTGEILSLNGTAVVAGPNTLTAKGFTSQGTGSTFKKDAINSAFTTNEANITAFILTYRSGNGNLGFGRIFHMSNGDDFFNEGTSGYRLEREFSTTDGEWRITRPSASTWASVSYSHDGSTSAPAMYGNGAAMAVTTVTAPVGTFAPGNTAHVIGNHTNYTTTGSERNWDGRLCEYWRLSAVKNAAWHLAMHTQLISPATFASAQTGSATP